MNNRTKLTILIGAVAAVISALVLIVVFWDKLLSLCPCRKDEDAEDAVSEVLNFSTMRVKSETMLHYLEQTKVYVSSGSACSRGAASHTLGAMGLEPRRIDTALRVSFCAENTEADVDALLNGLEQGLKTLAQLR